MNVQSFEKTDRKILGIALVVLLLSTLLLWQDAWIYRIIQSRHFKAEKIGEVTVLKNDVRRRFEVALSWLPLSNKNDVYQGDSVFTGDNSNVEITTISGEVITIAANSLVVINRKKDSISLDIGFGSVEGQVGNGKKLFITSNNNLAELSGNNGSVKIDAGDGSQLLLNVLAGEVRVRTDSGDKIMRGSDSGEILRNGGFDDASKPNIELIGPSAEQKFKLDEEKPVVFNWKTKRKYSRMKIKVSTDPNFTNSIIDTRIDDNSFSAYNLPKDTELYWQVLAEGGISTVQKFAIVGDRPPIPVLPKPGHHFFYDQQISPGPAGTSVELSWEPGSPATHYEVQLANNQIFTKNLVVKKIRSTKMKYELLQDGEYYWRVRSIDFPNMSWSPPSAFKVGPVPTRILSPPLTQMVENLFLIPTKIHGIAAETIHSLRTRGAQKYIEKFPRIMWSPIAGADRYLIEISKNKSFSEILVSQTVPRTYYNWKYIEPGTYYWRAKGLSENSKDGLYSQTQELKIAVQAPAALSKSSIIDEVPDQILLNAPPPAITISWNPTIFSKAYEIEFSNSSEFKNPTHFITNSSSKQIQLATAGIYFWRIRSLDGNKMPVSPFSSTYTLEFQRVFKDPLQNKNLLAIYPKQQDSIILVGRSQSEIQFKWTRPYVDAEYRIELSYEPNFESVFYSASTKENHLAYTEMFHGGVVYWRIRAEKKDFVTDWTGANRFLVSYENRPFDFEKSDLFFAARLKAKERQLAMLAAQKRRIAQLRTPAGALELQLDTPQLIEPPTSFLIESNIDPTLNAQKLANLPSDKMYTLVKGYPVIRWKKVPAAERYVIEIAKDKDFTQTVTKSPTWNPFYSWDAARPGQFYYRIQAFNDRYKRSQFTDAYPLQVTVAAVTPTSQDTFVEVYDEPREMWQPPEPFTLSWKPVVFARGYEVEFSEDNSFSLAKVYKTNETSTDIRVNRAGLYYWRVRPINEHLVGIAPFSTIRSVEVIQTNRRPASLENITGLFPIKRTMLFVGEGIMNLAFHWNSPEPNTSVELEVSDTKNFEKILSRKISKKGAAVISNDLPEGHLYWRVKSKSTVSAVNEFYLRRERKPYTPEVKADLSH